MRCRACGYGFVEVLSTCFVGAVGALATFSFVGPVRICALSLPKGRALGVHVHRCVYRLGGQFVVDAHSPLLALCAYAPARPKKVERHACMCTGELTD